ncbi:polysaccharide deacetylase family protein [Hydrogenoanaerobacterium sp.]|uniref:polysaccharide deacetylase family protein n=1 Tax=Hydrogenoanaerobacterium sp. TaxID=2953763 RepID=UPI00289F1D35|nr:polysaccharide deacetylase family protein [Hydrogenoanaerobacterium sp.]
MSFLKLQKSILPLILSVVLLVLSACGNTGKSERTIPPKAVPESPSIIKKNNNHGSDYEIYDIRGTADSITGVKWENMLAQRSASTEFAKQYRNLVFVNMNPDENTVYLTFDDGPDPTNTVSVMNTLLKYDVGATFFFTGENMRQNNAVVKQVHDNGFAIGLHGYDHTSLVTLPEADVKSQLNNTNDLLEKTIGKRASIMRPPYGDLDDSTIQTIGALNERIYLWSLDTLDWAQKDESEILRNVKENLRPGDIILMHAAAGMPLSAKILPEMIEYIQLQGYEMKALPEPNIQ